MIHTTQQMKNASSAMHVRNYEVILMEFGAYKLHKTLLLYVPPVLLFLGTIGNLLSVVILTRKGMRRHSAYFYLAVLSTADTLVLYIGLLRLWVGEMTGEDVRDKDNWACKLISAVGYTLSDFSGWLIIAVTVERYIAVCYPLKASLVTNRQKAVKVVLTLLSLLFLVNCHFFWTVEVSEIHSGGNVIPMCQGVPSPGYKKFIDNVWPWIDAIIYSFLPFVIILFLNALIGREVMRARRERHMLSAAEGTKVFGSGPPPAYTATEGGRITVMLLTVSFTFLATTLPMNVTIIAARFLSNDDLQATINFRLVRTITELLMYLNHSINFFLYCATGQKFRNQLLYMLHQRRRSGQGGGSPPSGSSNQLNRASIPQTDLLAVQLVPLREARCV